MASSAPTRQAAKDIYDEMTALYPDWVSHQSWLMFNFPKLTVEDA